MKEYQFGLPNSDRIVVIQAKNFREAVNLFRAQMKAEGIDFEQ